jgi:hypothetical protein
MSIRVAAIIGAWAERSNSGGLCQGVLYVRGSQVRSRLSGSVGEYQSIGLICLVAVLCVCTSNVSHVSDMCKHPLPFCVGVVWTAL